MYEHKSFIVQNGDIKEFIDIVLLLLNFTPDEDSYIYLNIQAESSSCKGFLVPENIMQIIIDIHDYYQPRMIKKNVFYHEITIQLKRNYLEFYYPIARERIDLKLWLKDILLQRNISQKSIDNLF